MDSLTHIYFAYKLLKITGGNPSAAVCSLFPQIDRVPAYLHRMYGHPFAQVASLAPIGVSIYWNKNVEEEAQHSYAAVRFREERSRMRKFEAEFEVENGFSLGAVAPDPDSAALAYVSHTYQDIFNNPMQAFLPYSAYPCGKWSLWERVGAIDFRCTLYAAKNIAAFRKEFFAHRIWEAKLEGCSLISAIIAKTADACAVPLKDDVVAAARTSLGIRNVTHSAFSDALDFLTEHETVLGELIAKYSSTALSHSPREVELFPVLS